MFIGATTAGKNNVHTISDVFQRGAKPVLSEYQARSTPPFSLFLSVLCAYLSIIVPNTCIFCVCVAVSLTLSSLTDVCGVTCAFEKKWRACPCP